MKVGESVVYHDPVARPHEALITAVWGNDDRCLLNVVIVSSDESQTDSYGRQIQRVTSLMHVSASNVHGNYWRKHDEKPNEVVQPVSK